MSKINVAIVNGISLQVVASESEQLVAVKPVCAIYDKMQHNEVRSNSH